MDGGARVAARCRISRFIIENFAASLGMIQSRISLHFALHATQSCIGELIEEDGGQSVRGDQTLVPLPGLLCSRAFVVN